MVFDCLGDGVESYASGPHDETGVEDVFCYLAVGRFEGVVDFVFFDFGDPSVGYDVDFVVGEFFFGVFADFFVVGV